MDDKRLKGICFVIAPIGAEASETRKRSDQVLKHLLEPIGTSCNYEVLRADRISKSGFITSQVIQHLTDDPLVIADLTDHNANVFYELAIRHTVRKPYIQIIHKLQTIPFDVTGVRTIHFDHQDLDSVEQFKKDLTEAIRAVEGKTDIENPFSVAVDVAQLRSSTNPEKKALADLSYGLSEVRGILNTLVSVLRPSTEYPNLAYSSNRNAPGSSLYPPSYLSTYDERVPSSVLPYGALGPTGPGGAAGFFDDEDMAPPPIPIGMTGPPPGRPEK